MSALAPGRAACIDGAVMAPEAARISVYDRGLLYGDGVFEALRTIRGAPFALEEHLARLARSAAILRMPAPPLDVIASEVTRTVAAAGGEDSYVRVMLTRGEPAPGAAPGLAIDPAARLRRIVLVEPFRPQPPELYTRGVRAITVDVRRAHDTSGAKLLPYVVSMLALDDARARGASDAIFVDADGLALEGATSNLFLVKGGRLVTAGERDPILLGITRGHVLEDARGLGIAVDLAAPHVAALYGADEAFLTSSLREVIPVVAIDDRPIGTGAPGPITQRVHAAIRARRDAFNR